MMKVNFIMIYILHKISGDFNHQNFETLFKEYNKLLSFYLFFKLINFFHNI